MDLGLWWGLEESEITQGPDLFGSSNSITFCNKILELQGVGTFSCAKDGITVTPSFFPEILGYSGQVEECHPWQFNMTLIASSQVQYYKYFLNMDCDSCIG